MPKGDTTKEVQHAQETQAYENSEDFVAPTSAGKLPILVKTALSEDRVLEIEAGNTITTLLEVIATEHGWRLEELILVREGDDEPLSDTVRVDGDYPYRRRHHVHHRSEVKVIVNYQAESRHREFRPQSIVESILFWAIKAFNIDPAMATEFELTRHGTQEELPGTEHIGHLAGHQRQIELDLIRGDIANGARP
jgi:hypothetical protein